MHVKDIKYILHFDLPTVTNIVLFHSQSHCACKTYYVYRIIGFMAKIKPFYKMFTIGKWVWFANNYIISSCLTHNVWLSSIKCKSKSTFAAPLGINHEWYVCNCQNNRLELSNDRLSYNIHLIDWSSALIYFSVFKLEVLIFDLKPISTFDRS
jgi:hypothetical protein